MTTKYVIAVTPYPRALGDISAALRMAHQLHATIYTTKEGVEIADKIKFLNTKVTYVPPRDVDVLIDMHTAMQRLAPLRNKPKIVVEHNNYDFSCTLPTLSTTHNQTLIIANPMGQTRAPIKEPWDIVPISYTQPAYFISVYAQNRAIEIPSRLYEVIDFAKEPITQQHYYDDLLRISAVNIVRGEDSLIRAILAGRPFLWDYPRHLNPTECRMFLQYLLQNESDELRERYMRWYKDREDVVDIEFLTSEPVKKAFYQMSIWAHQQPNYVTELHKEVEKALLCSNHSVE